MGSGLGSHSVSVCVWYDGDVLGRGDQPRVELVEGPKEELFVDALVRTFGVPALGNRFSLVHVRDHSVLSAREWLGEIDEHVTLGDAAALAAGHTLEVDSYGRGGGPLPLMWDIVSTGLTIVGLVQGGQWAWERVHAARFRNHRAAAQEWVDAGIESEPSRALKLYVYAESQWNRDEFDRAFALDRMAGSALLRALNFQKVGTSPEVWAERGAETGIGIRV